MVDKIRQSTLDVLVAEHRQVVVPLDCWIVSLTDQRTVDLDVYVQGTGFISVPVDVQVAASRSRVSALDMLIGADGFRFTGIDVQVAEPWSYGAGMSARDAIVRLREDGDQISGVIRGTPCSFEFKRTGDTSWLRFGFAINFYRLHDNSMKILVGDVDLFKIVAQLHQLHNLDRVVVTLTRRIRPETRSGEGSATEVSPRIDGYEFNVSDESAERPPTFWPTVDAVPLFDLATYDVQTFAEALK